VGAIHLHDHFIQNPSWAPPPQPFVHHVGLHERAPSRFEDILSRFPGAETLEVSRQALDVEAIEALLPVSASAARWRRLLLSEVELSDDALEVLLARAPALRALDLSGNPLTSQSVECLARWRGLSSVEALNLSDTQIDHAGLRDLIDAVDLRELRHLALGSLDLLMENVTALKPLVSSSVHTLDLSECHLLDEGAALLAAFAWPHLRSLHLSGNDLEQRGVRALLDADSLRQIHTLDVGFSKVDDDVVRALTAGESLPCLRVLGLTSTRMGDSGARAVAASSEGSAITALDLSRCAISDAGLRALIDSPLFARLRILDVRDNPITADGVQTLLRATRDRPEMECYVDCDALDAGLVHAVRERWPEHLDLRGALSLTLDRGP